MNTLYQPFTMEPNGTWIWELEYCFLVSWGVFRCWMGKERWTSLLKRKQSSASCLALQYSNAQFSFQWSLCCDINVPDFALAGAASGRLQNVYCKGKYNKKLYCEGTSWGSLKILHFPIPLVLALSIEVCSISACCSLWPGVISCRDLLTISSYWIAQTNH